MNNPNRPTPVITVRNLANIILGESENSDWLLVDVRTEEEYHLAHIAQTHLVISHDELEYRIHEFEPFRDRTIYFVCRSGRRSGYTTDLLLAAGFPRVFNVAGGVIAWVDAGFALVPTPRG